MSVSSGIVYLCTGSYQDMLRNSLHSLNTTNKGKDFHVLSDRPLSVPFTWVPSWIEKESRRIKTRLHEHTPFDLTLFVDTDTVFGESIDIADMLKDADVAMALDANPNLIRGAKTFLNYPGFTTTGEVEETLSMCGADFPFYNSGVMVWRKTERTRDFFEKWHSEWLKYRRVDQFALARALFITGTKVKRLEQRFNFPVVSGDVVHDKAIYHLIFKENVARQAGLWDPGFAELMKPELIDVIGNGSRSDNHYLHIGREIFEDETSTTLIVCPNDDENFWLYCCRGKCEFVVEGNALVELNGFEKHALRFNSKVGEWLGDIDIPDRINHSVDYVIVNGPAGFNEGCPGRELSIAWASSVAQKKIYVFDYNRKWERVVCDRYLGKPKTIIPPRGKGDAYLAIFHRS